MNADTLPKNHEARSVYNRMIEVFFYFKSLEDLNETVHEHFMGYGTAAHEFFKNREELMGMARMQAEQLRDQEFTLNRKPVEAKLLDNGTTCLIVEEFELHMHTNEHRLSLRLSTILEHIDNKWVVTHFHGSTPDTDIAEEEAFPEEGLRRKNEELEAKIKERTRELEIEAALERVRASTMAMNSSKDLSNVASALFEQMRLLGGDLFAFGIVLCDKHKNKVEQWHSLGDGGMLSPFTVPVDLDYIHQYRYDQWKAGEKLFSIEIPEDYITQHFELMFELPSVKAAMDQVEAGGAEVTIPKWEIDYGASFSHGYLLVSSLKPFKEDQIFPRFAKVFEQAYTRFLDLQKAEAQAREAQVEAALERVRARTMAMQHSDELAEASHLLDKEVRDLGIKTWGCAFNIYREKDAIEWFGNEQGLLPTYTVPREGIFKEYYDLGQQGETLYVKEFSGAECIAHYEYMSTLPVVGDVLKQLKKTNGSFPSYQIDHVVFFKHGYLLFITREAVPEAYDTFKRFAQVFEQTYTRFLDLQKAEAQAREARIENALEKVRSRSIGMQKSEELREVIQVIHDQLIHLNFQIDAAGFTLDYHQNNDWNVWIANKSGSLPSLMFIPYIDHPQFNYYKYAKEKGLDFLANTLTFEEKNSIFMYMFRFMGDYPQAEKDELLSKPGLAISQAFLKNISLWIYNLDAIPYSEEENDTLMRFAKVFEQTFVRFNDLQKAEAQARESQIELALERIRAQVTGMQESSELLDIVVTMRSEFVKLGHEAHYFWHMRWLPDIYEKAMTSGDGTRIGMVMELPRHMHGEIPLLADWEKGKEPTVVYAMDAEAAVDYVDKMVSLGNFQQIDPQAPGPDDIRAIGGLTFVMARTTHGEIGFSLPGVVPDPPAEDLETLVRFTAVFDLAYRRFEDLKDSERQKREAEIELALERIRARTMAMQNSEELKEVIQVIFNQLSALQINAEHAGIVVDYEPGQDWNFWIAETQDIPSRISVPYLDLPWDRQFAEAKEKGKDFFTTHLNFEEKNSFYEKLLPHIPGITKKVQDFYFKCPGLAISTVIQNDIGLYIENFSGTPYSEEEDAILMRFGKVFQQTYTRFLDLKKAEAQAREAQIEAALEKVRTRTMAMQKGEELKEVVVLLYKELIALGVTNFVTCGYVEINEEINRQFT
ncbi:MAG: nuclear transport factor 2 family protein, partial [Eudoraea sp.]|nr:nuclear transport factor 2 family protein [Eudoraea sp.]